MELSHKLLLELQNRLKVGNRRGVHLNAIPGRSRYKFDLQRLSFIDKSIPNNFVDELLSKRNFKFKISWKDNVPDLNTLFEEDQTQIVRITKSFENLINQTEAIESEKGINTFGFGFPILIRRDQKDNKLTTAPILIWSLRIKRTKEFNTWEILRDEDDPIYINEVLINHLQSDSLVEVKPIPSEMLDDGLIDKKELTTICLNLIHSINSTSEEDLEDTFIKKLRDISVIHDKKYYEDLSVTSNNSFIEFGGLFSIFEVQKQNIIHDYDSLLDLENAEVDLNEMNDHFFQPISSVETDPSQQSILHALNSTRNILIQGPPGTGKSQSLTAILINALENHKKTIVVCEKRTALEVLHNALIKKGLGDTCILIKDVIKDRRLVVDSVRNRIELNDYKRESHPYSKKQLDNILSNAKKAIDEINNKHAKLDKNLIHNNNWTYYVGALLEQLRLNNESYELKLKKGFFEYNLDEFNKLKNLIKNGNQLYSTYVDSKAYTFLNPRKLVGNNPYSVEKKIQDDFNYYKNSFSGKNSIINKLLNSNMDNSDFFNIEKTEKIFYKFLALFSKKKKQTLRDQTEFWKKVSILTDRISKDDWFETKLINKHSRELIESIGATLDTEEKYFLDEGELFTKEFDWFSFYNGLTKKNQKLLNALKNKNDWLLVFLKYYFNSLLEINADGDLPVNDRALDAYTDSIVNLEKVQIDYIQNYWRAKLTSASREFYMKNTGITVENLYNKRSSSKFKRLSLRQIVKKDKELFTAFFPIILTTPDVCSNLFNGSDKYFDIVMFDEASQLKVEDNLPAILKGKQIIIAGDEHQMPPSNYFSKIFEGSIDDEDELEDDDEIVIDQQNILLSSESLLDFATELNFEKKYLDFHYRSRHPYLINFSNHAFYQKRLKPLPNQFDYNPIKYINVDGTYSDHTNEAEAEMVLSILDKNIQRLPDGKYPSIGIATFNIAQRNLIKSKIIERKKFDHFTQFNEKIIELEEAGLFVKNLENIQGDERDVIILSTTYGINKEGKFAQRFGPINHKKGYKLLNVIITRAKYKVYVCTSIPENVFQNYKDHLEMEGSNNRKAIFYAYLAYAKAISENNENDRLTVLKTLSDNSNIVHTLKVYDSELESPFEEEVYEALLDNFDKTSLIPQYQFAGFRVDIVYKSKIEGVPNIAIECDGASYHSSKEAYLYDKYRQNILEDNGFVFHRIWSTNWWRNPKRELKRLLEFIKKVEEKDDLKFHRKPNYTSAFTDDVSYEHQIDGQEEINVDEHSIKSTFEPVVNEQITLFDESVQKNSIVKIKYLNIGKDLTVQLVENEINRKMVMNGIQKINNRSPLATSLFGKFIGDTVKVGNLDNYVKVLDIINA